MSTINVLSLAEKIAANKARKARRVMEDRRILERRSLNRGKVTELTSEEISEGYTPSVRHYRYTEKDKEKKREYYLKHREERLAYIRQYCKKNKDKIREYYYNNRESILEKKKEKYYKQKEMKNDLRREI